MKPPKANHPRKPELKTKASSKRKVKAVSEAARLFMGLVEDLSFQQGPRPQSRPLTNLTFWAGAGFSKSWNPKAPIGSELFTLNARLIERVANSSAMSRMFGIDLFEVISPDQLRHIVYQLDMSERYPDVRPRYIDDQNVH